MIIVVMIVFYILLSIQPYSLLRIIKGSKNYAVYLIQKVGVEAINQEAERIFDDFYKRNVPIYSLSEEELSQYPVIANFAYSTVISILGTNKNKSMQPNIVIKYGTHAMPDFVYIFDRRTPSPYFVNSNQKLEKITENIFLVTK